MEFVYAKNEEANEEQNLYHLLSEMSRLRLDILGIVETHWNSWH